MKKTSICVVILLALLIATQAQTRPSVNDLRWITGCWATMPAPKKATILEQWMAPDGGAMLGMSRTVRDGKMTEFEFLRIVDDGAVINYIARPSANSSETPFKLIKWSAQEITFENAQHDFPQRIIYRLTGTDAITARIEGDVNGKLKGIDFPYVRSRCG